VTGTSSNKLSPPAVESTDPPTGNSERRQDAATKERAALVAVFEAARRFFSQPYDNGQWEQRLRDAVRAAEKLGR